MQRCQCYDVIVIPVIPYRRPTWEESLRTRTCLWNFFVLACSNGATEQNANPRLDGTAPTVYRALNGPRDQRDINCVALESQNDESLTDLSLTRLFYVLFVDLATSHLQDQEADAVGVHVR